MCQLNSNGEWPKALDIKPTNITYYFGFDMAISDDGSGVCHGISAPNDRTPAEGVAAQLLDTNDYCGGFDDCSPNGGAVYCFSKYFM